MHTYSIVLILFIQSVASDNEPNVTLLQLVVNGKPYKETSNIWLSDENKDKDSEIIQTKLVAQTRRGMDDSENEQSEERLEYESVEGLKAYVPISEDLNVPQMIKTIWVNMNKDALAFFGVN